MNTLVVGAAGKTGSHVLRMVLAAHLGPVRGMVRRPEHRDAVAAFGAQPVLADVTEVAQEGCSTALEDGVAGVDAVICAIGASRPEDAEAVDHVGTARLIRAAVAAGVPRFVLISSMGSDCAERFAADLRPLLVAKLAAERVLRAAALEWTILRPGGLTDQQGTGLVRIAPSLEIGGSVPRADVARVAVAVLRLGLAGRRAFDLLAGDTPVDEALRGLSARPA